jgi:hypothetical protein
MELYPFKWASERLSKKNEGVGGTKDTIEENILGNGNEGITKTVEMRVVKDYTEEKGEIRGGETQGYEERRSGF